MCVCVCARLIFIMFWGLGRKQCLVGTSSHPGSQNLFPASTLNFGQGVLKEVVTATVDYELDKVTILLSDSDRL